MSALDVTAMRRSLGLGAYLYGHLEPAEAAEVAGLTVAALEEEARRLGARPASDDEARPFLSIVLPVCNEEANLEPLAERLTKMLAAFPPSELIFVDDGSRDRSLEILTDLHAADPRMKVIRLSRNFGHQNALSAGLDRASGRAVVMMDADGQDPPELLPELVDRWQAGHDVVFAVRARRREVWWKRAAYRLFYRLLVRVGELPIPPDAGDFCLVDARVADVLRALPERGQFLRGLRSWAGFRQVGVPYDRPSRAGGESKYGFSHLVRLALDGLLSFSTAPLRLASWLGLLTSLVGFAYLVVGITYRLFIGHVPTGWTSLVALVVLFGGAQLIVIGVLGEYLARVYAEVKRRPRYVVQTTYW